MRKTTTLTRLSAAGAAFATAAAGALLLAPTSGATAAPGVAEQPGSADLTGLKVLLTNDDSIQGRDQRIGTDGKGLYELRQALCDAGADVLVVAPWQQQSGASARITTPGFEPEPMTVQAATPPEGYGEDCAETSTEGAVFGVCLGSGPCDDTTPSASPADAVSVALSRFSSNFWPEGPDVVLSGTNFGQNVGTTVNHSGTVGAAVTAHEYDVPVVAFSAEVPLDDLSQIANMPFAETADFAVALLTAMVERDRLQPDVLLNVNHPFVGEDETLGDPVSTVVGSTDPLGATYLGDGDREGATYELVPTSPEPESQRDADTAALQRNDISVTALDGDWGRHAQQGRLTGLLKAIDRE